MLKAIKKPKSNEVKVYNENHLIGIVIVTGSKKVEKVTYVINDCPNELSLEKWQEGKDKTMRIHGALNQILVGKSYKDFFWRETSD